MFNLKEATLRRHATAPSWERGEDYYRHGNVSGVVRRGQILQAEVFGSQVHPYGVCLHLDSGGVTEATCSCPYSSEFEGWCKHIVATLLACMKEPESIEERPPLAEMLLKLDLAQTRQLLQNLVKEQPELLALLDRLLDRTIVTPQGPEKSKLRPGIDPAPFRKQVRYALRNAVRCLEEGWEDELPISPIFDLIETANNFIQAEDGRNALIILEAIASTCCEEWEDVADYGGEAEEVAVPLNKAWTEAILRTDLDEAEKTDLQVILSNCQDEWSVDLEMSLAALCQGWDEPSLQQILQGNLVPLWPQEVPEYANELADIRLNILAEQKRYAEYLHLARSEGRTQRYLTMLGRLGRVDEAMKEAQILMQRMEESFALAQTLREQGALPQALDIAKAGLELPGNCQYNLAKWTSELAEGLGDRPTALDAQIKAFAAQPSFEDYSLVEQLAGTEWSKVKPELLTILRGYSQWNAESAKVKIFLHEGLLDEAIVVVEYLSDYHLEIIHSVMEATVAHRPDWVIENACRRAKYIMDEKKAKYYDRAVGWLKKAKAAYLASGRTEEWSAYLRGLRSQHSRKYKLIALLEELNGEFCGSISIMPKLV